MALDVTGRHSGATARGGANVPLGATALASATALGVAGRHSGATARGGTNGPPGATALGDSLTLPGATVNGANLIALSTGTRASAAALGIAGRHSGATARGGANVPPGATALGDSLTLPGAAVNGANLIALSTGTRVFAELASSGRNSEERVARSGPPAVTAFGNAVAYSDVAAGSLWPGSSGGTSSRLASIFNRLGDTKSACRSLGSGPRNVDNTPAWIALDAAPDPPGATAHSRAAALDLHLLCPTHSVNGIVPRNVSNVAGGAVAAINAAPAQREAPAFSAAPASNRASASDPASASDGASAQ
jgi:hypothetical protein